MGSSIFTHTHTTDATTSVAAAAPMSATAVSVADDADDNVCNHSAMDFRYRFRFSCGDASRGTLGPISSVSATP